MRKVWIFPLAMLILATPSMAGNKSLMGALLGAGAGAAIGHAADRSGGAGKGAAIGAIGGYILGSQMEQGEKKARQEGRNEAKVQQTPLSSGAQLPAQNCRSADEYISRASASRNNDDKIYFLEKAVKLCPDRAQAHNDLGVAYYSRNERHDRDRARNEFNEALRINPNYTVARDNLRSL